jgi:hypothetical protein
MHYSLSARVDTGQPSEGKEFIMLWTVLVILVVLWLLGLLSGFAGNLIHLVLLLAGIVLIAQLLTGRRTI